MDFTVSEKMQTIVGMIDEFVDKELIPLEPVFLRDDMATLEKEIKDKQRLVKQMELWAPNHPVEYGGMGLDLMEHALVSEALGRTPLGHYVFGCQAPDAGNAEILHLHGTPEQKARYLKPLIQGDIRSCFSMTEVELPGSNPLMMETTAVKDGDDYVINGQKWYTTASDGAEFAIVMAVTNPDAPPYLQASMIIVPTEHPRVQPGPVHPGHGRNRYGLFQPRRNPLSVLPGSAEKPAGTRRPRVRHCPGTAGPRTHPPLHALDRHLQPGHGPHVPACGIPPHRPRSNVEHQTDRSGLDRGIRR